MKYHKLPGIDKAVCTCEQKIAYNLAFRAHINYWRDWDSVKGLDEVSRAWGVEALVEKIMLDYDVADVKKYDREAVKTSLSAGLAKYLDRFFVAGSYEQIGRAFPAAE